MGIHIFPVLANNSIDSLLRAHLPLESMGRHLGRITLLWTLPGYLLAIPLAGYVDRHAGGGDAGFYRALFRVMLGTAVFQVPASLLILGVPRRRTSADRREPGAARLRDIAAPFRNAAYRRLLLVVLVFAVLTSMIYSFINPYLLQVRGMAMRTIGAISAAVAILSIGALPFWGRLADRIGGKNILRVAVSGFALGVLALIGEGAGFVLLFALLCWEGMRGIFGSGIYSTQRYLAQVLSDGRKPNIDFAAATFCSGAGWAAGAVLGGLLLEWLERRAGLLPPFHRYRIYFACCLAGCLLLGRLVLGLEEDRRRLGWREIGAAMFRAAGRGLRRPR
jgi:predicted MFS family arabinose efflux permease